MHNATAITTGSANQRPNSPCISLWIDVTFRGLEDSYIQSDYLVWSSQMWKAYPDKILDSGQRCEGNCVGCVVCS